MIVLPGNEWPWATETSSTFQGRITTYPSKGSKHWTRLTVGVDQTSLKGLRQHILSHLSFSRCLYMTSFIQMRASWKAVSLGMAGLSSDPRELLWHLAMQRDSRKRLSTRLLPCLVAPAVHQRLKRGPWGSQPGREWRREEKV